MSTTPAPSADFDEPPDHGRSTDALVTGQSPMKQFRLAFAIYFGWAVIAWLSTTASVASITNRAAAVLLLGIVATNALFFAIARGDALHRPPSETTALAQGVVGIAWTTLFASMSTGTGELVVGIYASIFLFAMLRVNRSVLNQIAVFAVASYSIVDVFKTVSVDPASLSAASLIPPVIFAVTMVFLSVASRNVYRCHYRLHAELADLKDRFRQETLPGNSKSGDRRYILDLLAREKGRTDRSNVPFCVCVFSADYIEKDGVAADEHGKIRALKGVETTIRDELREMDSLNATGFHECFGPYSDKEYIAILPQTNLHGAQRSVERVLASVASRREVSGAHVELCGGIAEYRRGEVIPSLLARAEEALGKARASGANHVCSSEGGLGTTEMRYADVVRLETRRK